MKIKETHRSAYLVAWSDVKDTPNCDSITSDGTDRVEAVKALDCSQGDPAAGLNALDLTWRTQPGSWSAGTILLTATY